MNLEKIERLLNLKRHLKTTLPLFILVVGVLYWTASKREKSREEIAKVQELWNKGEYLQVAALVKKHSALSSRYEKKLAQVELASGNYRRAQKVTRGKSAASLFSKTAITIAEQKYTQALEESYELKGALDTSSDLYGFLLVRIAVLCDELGDTKGSKECWREIKGLSSYSRLEDHFKDQGVFLSRW